MNRRQVLAQSLALASASLLPWATRANQAHAVELWVAGAPGSQADVLARLLSLALLREANAPQLRVVHQPALSVSEVPTGALVLASTDWAANAPKRAQASAINPVTARASLQPWLGLARDPLVVLQRSDEALHRLNIQSAATPSVVKRSAVTPRLGEAQAWDWLAFSEGQPHQVVHAASAGAALNALLRGEVDRMALPVSLARSQLQTGLVQADVLLDDRRSSLLPDLPILAERVPQRLHWTPATGHLALFSTPSKGSARADETSPSFRTSGPFATEALTEVRREAFTRALADRSLQAHLQAFGLEAAPTDGPTLAARLQPLNRAQPESPLA